MAMLEPKLAILDETDSGLDIDALKLLPTELTNLKVKTMLYWFTIIKGC